MPCSGIFKYMTVPIEKNKRKAKTWIKKEERNKACTELATLHNPNTTIQQLSWCCHCRLRATVWEPHIHAQAKQYMHAHCTTAHLLKTTNHNKNKQTIEPKQKQMCLRHGPQGPLLADSDNPARRTSSAPFQSPVGTKFCREQQQGSERS